MDRTVSESCVNNLEIRTAQTAIVMVKQKETRPGRVRQETRILRQGRHVVRQGMGRTNHGRGEVQSRIYSGEIYPKGLEVYPTGDTGLSHRHNLPEYCVT